MNIFTTSLRKRRARKGAVAVEFALVLPLLFLMMFAFYEISRASMIQHATEASAYEGARAGIIPGATQQEIEDQVGFILRSVGVENFTVDVQQNVTVDDAMKVQVTVNVPFTEILSGTLLFDESRFFTAQTELGEETL